MSSPIEISKGVTLSKSHNGDFQVTHWDPKSMVEDKLLRSNTWLGFTIHSNWLPKPQTDTLVKKVAATYSEHMNALSPEFYKKLDFLTEKAPLHSEEGRIYTKHLKLFSDLHLRYFMENVKLIFEHIAFSFHQISNIQFEMGVHDPAVVPKNEFAYFPWAKIPLHLCLPFKEHAALVEAQSRTSQLVQALGFENEIRRIMFHAWTERMGPNESQTSEAFYAELYEDFSKIENEDDCDSFLDEWLGGTRTQSHQIDLRELTAIFLEFKKTESKQKTGPRLITEISNALRGERIQSIENRAKEAFFNFYMYHQRTYKELILGTALSKKLVIDTIAKAGNLDQDQFESGLILNCIDIAQMQLEAGKNNLKTWSNTGIQNIKKLMDSDRLIQKVVKNLNLFGTDKVVFDLRVDEESELIEIDKLFRILSSSVKYQITFAKKPDFELLKKSLSPAFIDSIIEVKDVSDIRYDPLKLRNKKKHHLPQDILSLLASQLHEPTTAKELGLCDFNRHTNNTCSEKNNLPPIVNKDSSSVMTGVAKADTKKIIEKKKYISIQQALRENIREKQNRISEEDSH